MLISILAVLLGLVLLTYGAERFVMGASGLAHSLGMSPMIIGLTIVAFATSAPEMLVSGVAAWSGKSGLAVGNAVGSNIANIGLVLGMTALIAPLSVHSNTIKREFPLMFMALILAYVLLLDGDLSRIDGVILLTGMVLMICVTVYLGKHPQAADPVKEEFESEVVTDLTTRSALLWLVLGCGLMLAGSQALVHGAVDIARSMGVSDLVIGLTIVAIGTSLPELAASVMSAVKGEQDIALGNIIGSNMFNMLGVLCLPGLINPVQTGRDVLIRDFPFMFLLSILMFFMAFGFRKAGIINRFEGLILFAGFICYQYFLLQGQGS